jgi:hypothetical protein
LAAEACETPELFPVPLTAEVVSAKVTVPWATSSDISSGVGAVGDRGQAKAITYFNLLTCPPYPFSADHFPRGIMSTHLK